MYRVCEHATEAHASRADAVTLGERDLWLGAIRASETLARSSRAGSLVQLSGRKSRKPTITGTSLNANVNDTRVWQLAFLPSTEAYCGATPTERLPFFGSAVSSTICQVSSLPTCLSASASSAASSGAVSHTPLTTNDAADRS